MRTLTPLMMPTVKETSTLRLKAICSSLSLQTWRHVHGDGAVDPVDVGLGILRAKLSLGAALLSLSGEKLSFGSLQRIGAYKAFNQLSPLCPAEMFLVFNDVFAVHGAPDFATCSTQTLPESVCRTARLNQTVRLSVSLLNAASHTPGCGLSRSREVH